MCWSPGQGTGLTHPCEFCLPTPMETYEHTTPHGTLARWPLTAQPGTHCPPLAKVRHRTSFSRTGSRTGSSSSPTFSSRKGFPKLMVFSRVERKSRSLSLATSRLFSLS